MHAIGVSHGEFPRSSWLGSDLCREQSISINLLVKIERSGSFSTYADKSPVLGAPGRLGSGFIDKISIGFLETYEYLKGYIYR